jgi:quinol monooxygenase YgiN
MINGTAWLVVTKLDVLDELKEIPVCVGYKIDGKATEEIPAEACGWEKIECVYRTMAGWHTPTQGITELSKLPKAAREYLNFVEKESGARIGMVSTGPGREETIFGDEFAAELTSRNIRTRGAELAMVVLAVTWVAKVGREAEVAGLFSKLTEESRKEPGCAMYQVHRHRTEPRRFFIYEQYKDDAALGAHRNAPHFLQYAKKELPKMADRVEGQLYEPLG